MLIFRMKKSLFILLSMLLYSVASAQLNVIVSIQPEMEFVQKIGKEHIQTTLMVEAGSSPHTYEPKAQQMKAVAHADLYLAIGVEFERVWLERFKAQNPKLTIADIAQDINKTANNPHIWVDPIRVQQIAKNIYHALATADPEHQALYQKNLKAYLDELDALHQTIQTILKDVPQESAFMVFHPAWDYFAQRYHLKQLAIEMEGKSPKPRQLISLIKEAKRQKVKAIFTQPEFSDEMAQTIARELKIPVIKTSPLAKDWEENLKRLAQAIAQGTP